MANSEIDYNAVLADLEAKRTAIDSAIAGVRQMLNLGAEQGVAASGAPERKNQPSAVRFDSFFQMSLPASIIKFLGMATVPQSVSEITKALLDGGFKTTSKNLMPIVGSNLSRMKSNGEVVNIDGKWGLASWYPAARSAPAKPKGKRRGKSKKAESKQASGKAQTTPASDNQPKTSKPTTEQIEKIKSMSAAGKKLAEIAKAVGLHHFAVMRVLKAA